MKEDSVIRMKSMDFAIRIIKLRRFCKMPKNLICQVKLHVPVLLLVINKGNGVCGKQSGLYS